MTTNNSLDIDFGSFIKIAKERAVDFPRELNLINILTSRMKKDPFKLLCQISNIEIKGKELPKKQCLLLLYFIDQAITKRKSVILDSSEELASIVNSSPSSVNNMILKLKNLDLIEIKNTNFINKRNKVQTSRKIYLNNLRIAKLLKMNLKDCSKILQ